MAQRSIDGVGQISFTPSASCALSRIESDLRTIHTGQRLRDWLHNRPDTRKHPTGNAVTTHFLLASKGASTHGVNVIMLWSAAVAKGYASPYWITLRQANQIGAHVRKGERGEMVVYYGQAKKTRDNGAGDKVEDSFRFLKFFTAFNADQIDELPERFFPAPADAGSLPIAAHEAWFAKLDIKRILTQDIACYIPSKDVIGMPPLAAFESADQYAATLNHEAVHATGAAHRVGRDMSKRFSAHALAAEELVAEIGASILGAHLGLPPDHLSDHASYIGHWMKLLKDDKRAFLAAAAQAQTTVDWLLDKAAPPPQQAGPLQKETV